MVNKQMVLVEKISDLFSPLRYIPVPTCLVDSDFMDRTYPPRLDETLTIRGGALRRPRKI
jgi:hypothetical protein